MSNGIIRGFILRSNIEVASFSSESGARQFSKFNRRNYDLVAETGFTPPPFIIITDRSNRMLMLWIILMVIVVRLLFVFYSIS